MHRAFLRRSISARIGAAARNCRPLIVLTRSNCSESRGSSKVRHPQRRSQSKPAHTRHSLHLLLHALPVPSSPSNQAQLTTETAGVDSYTPFRTAARSAELAI